jgi:hypothetical protein
VCQKGLRWFLNILLKLDSSFMWSSQIHLYFSACFCLDSTFSNGSFWEYCLGVSVFLDQCGKSSIVFLLHKFVYLYIFSLNCLCSQFSICVDKFILSLLLGRFHVICPIGTSYILSSSLKLYNLRNIAE